MSEPHPKTLQYAPRPRWTKLRSARVVLITLIVLGVAAGWRWGPTVFQRSTLLLAQWQCMRHAEAADRVIYAAGANPKQNSIDTVATTRQPVPWCWRRMQKELPHLTGLTYIPPQYNLVFASTAPVFLHRADAGAGERLIVVQYCDFNAGEMYRMLNVRVVQPATWESPPKALWEQSYGTGRNWKHPVTVYAGQADPADASRFMVDFISGGRRWRLRCQLHRDNSVTFTGEEVK